MATCNFTFLGQDFDAADERGISHAVAKAVGTAFELTGLGLIGRREPARIEILNIVEGLEQKDKGMWAYMLDASLQWGCEFAVSYDKGWESYLATSKDELSDGAKIKALHWQPYAHTCELQVWSDSVTCDFYWRYRDWSRDITVTAPDWDALREALLVWALSSALDKQGIDSVTL